MNDRGNVLVIYGFSRTATDDDKYVVTQAGSVHRSYDSNSSGGKLISPSHIQMHIHTHTHTHSHTYIHIYTHIHIRIHIQTYAYSYSYACIYIYTYTYTRSTRHTTIAVIYTRNGWYGSGFNCR
jgi:hypothetical protein